jgi:hypothetical protein
MREHIHQLFKRPGLDGELKELFDALVQRNPVERLTREHCEIFSQGIKGELHVLLQANSKVPLVDASAEDQRWIAEGFDVVFTDERPLDRERFPSVAKLVLLRRVVRTIIGSVGLDQLLERGMSRPLVVDVRVELAGDRPPFRIHTTTPKSLPSGLHQPDSLPLIAEEDPSSRRGSLVSPNG